MTHPVKRRLQSACARNQGDHHPIREMSRLSNCFEETKRIKIELLTEIVVIIIVIVHPMLTLKRTKSGQATRTKLPQGQVGT